MMKLMRQTRVKDWFEYYRTPCVICGKTGGCMVNIDGSAVACIRVESETFFSKNSALPSYLHFLKGDKRKKIDQDEIEILNEGYPKQKNHVLNGVFRSLLDCLQLEDDHYKHLVSQERQLTDDQVSVRQYSSFPDKPWEIARMLQEGLEIDHFKGIPGFYLKDEKYWTIAGTKGILIPFRNHYNEIVGFQYRIDNPPNIVEVKTNGPGLKARVLEQPNKVQVAFQGEIISEQFVNLGKQWTTIYHDGDIKGWIRVVKGNRYFWLSSANKPHGTGSGNPAPIHVAVPTKKLQNWKEGELLKTRTAWLSEGPLKCDIAADCIEKLYDPLEIEDIGDTFLALPGVGAWRLAIPVLKEMGVEQVNLCFDADAVSNPHVKKHLMECAKELKLQGFKGNLILWNEDEGKGIDDFLLAGDKIPHMKKMF
ncbi:DUF3854 domain-containing protein [Robertmurraya sp. FSL R5-0851]|uniref:DUF3854 domain-containing protein n=1 Tax=Robertmurraya sp. FSL R5-0851 TaxID=2921584 RepID=UPI0030F5017F